MKYLAITILILAATLCFVVAWGLATGWKFINYTKNPSSSPKPTPSKPKSLKDFFPVAIKPELSIEDYYDLDTKNFKNLIPPKSDKECLLNYFKMLYPATNSKWWDSLSINQLLLFYNMLDWYYTPLIRHPKLPFPLNSIEELMNEKQLVNDRQRSLLGPYTQAYIPFFPMGASEPLFSMDTSGNVDILGNPTTGKYPLPASEKPMSWPTCDNSKDVCQVARPLMMACFINPFGISRQGFPSYAYVEATSFALEGAGGGQRDAPSCGLPYGNSNISSFDGTMSSISTKDAQKYAVAKPYEGIYGPGYIGTSTEKGAWGVKEDYTDPPGCDKMGVLGATSNNSGCVCVPNRGGFRSLPSLKLPDNKCYKNLTQLMFVGKNDKPINIIESTADNFDDLRTQIKILDENSNVLQPSDISYCPSGTPPNCDVRGYGLFYPMKGYGKFINLGKSGTFFSYVHLMLTIHDKEGYGVGLRYPFESICLTAPGLTGCASTQESWGCLIQQLQDLSSSIDQREYLQGFITIPKKDLFTNGSLNEYYDAIIQGGGGRVDFTSNGSIFTPRKPQVIFDPKYSESVWGKPLGVGQTRWQKGEYDELTGKVLKCENPWMNPMDDGGRLEYLGKNFIQFYCPPELNIKNPNYQKSMSKILPKFTSSEIEEICGNSSGSGSTSKGANLDTIQEFCIRWIMGMIIYGDTGQHTSGSSWPFGCFGTTGTKDYCIYSLLASMGWKSTVISMKPAVGGQGSVCEYPYYDSEILTMNLNPCSGTTSMQDGNCGPMGQFGKPPSTPGSCNKSTIPPSFSTNGALSTCKDMVVLDPTQNLDRYLIDGFIPAFTDFSTNTDTNPNNENAQKYRVSQLNRSYFTLNEASSDIPAQLSRKLYQPKNPIKFCYSCPGNNSSVPYLNRPYKNWKQMTDSLLGQVFINSGNGEQNFTNKDNIFSQWTKSQPYHQKNGCFVVGV